MWQTGYWQNDRVLCGRMLDLNPRSVTALYLLYRVELAEQNLAAAEEWLLRAVEIDPYKPILMWDGHSFLVELGRFYMETGRNEDAIRVLERAVGNKGDGVLAQELLINVLLQEGLYARVVAEATPIVEARPDQSQIRGSLVIALDKLGRHFEVIEPLQQLVREEPENAGLHALLGKAYVATGNLPAARHEFEIVLELAPGDPVATDVLRQIEAQSHSNTSAH
jgi:tetratricopeptide (TPR) repeat protein